MTTIEDIKRIAEMFITHLPFNWRVEVQGGYITTGDQAVVIDGTAVIYPRAITVTTVCGESTIIGWGVDIGTVDDVIVVRDDIQRGVDAVRVAVEALCEMEIRDTLHRVEAERWAEEEDRWCYKEVRP